MGNEFERINGLTLQTTQPGVEHVVIANENEAKWIATLLGLDTKKFVPLFTEKKTVSLHPQDNEIDWDYCAISDLIT